MWNYNYSCLNVKYKEGHMKVIIEGHMRYWVEIRT